jgi:hypothetical protein
MRGGIPPRIRLPWVPGLARPFPAGEALFACTKLFFGLRQVFERLR